MASFLKLPEDLKKIKGPVIGYVGLLTSRRLDIEIIDKIAILKPDWSVVLVGPEESCFEKSKLHHYVLTFKQLAAFCVDFKANCSIVH